MSFLLVRKAVREGQARVRPDIGKPTIRDRREAEARGNVG